MIEEQDQKEKADHDETEANEKLVPSDKEEDKNESKEEEADTDTSNEEEEEEEEEQQDSDQDQTVVENEEESFSIVDLSESDLSEFMTEEIIAEDANYNLYSRYNIKVEHAIDLGDLLIATILALIFIHMFLRDFIRTR